MNYNSLLRKAGEYVSQDISAVGIVQAVHSDVVLNLSSCLT